MAKKKGPRKTRFGAVAVEERGKYVRVRWREKGRTIERSKTDWEEACNFARQVETRIASGGIGAPDGTFAGVADAAMRREAFPSWGDVAYENLRSILRIHIIPALGSKKARLVTEDDCNAVLAAIYNAGFSKHTVAKAKKVLGYIGKYGVKNGVWVPGQEPTSGLKMPNSKRESMNVQLAPIEPWRIPTDAQADALVDAAWKYSERYGFVVEMARTCALRWSEIRGLKPEHFDWEGRTVMVFQSRNTRDAKTTKTIAGQRRVIIREDRIDTLKAWVSTRPDGRFLVETEHGNPVSSSNWSNVMDRLRARSGYPQHMALHSLRHYCGSRWRREGISLEDVSKMMGHANVNITATLYLHSDPEYLDRVRKII